MAKRAVIIGGGVIGIASAHYLGEAGWDVTLIDRGRLGGACSHGNCGLICPSHVLPLAEPGAIWPAFKAMFRSASPFRIKPRLDPGLWGWLWRFARRCKTRHMMEAGRAIQALLHASMTGYEDLLSSHPLECEWERRGLLFVYEDAGAFEAYAKTNQLLAEAFHEPARRLAGDELLRLEPALRPGLAGGWHYESDAHLRADRLLASWRRLLETRGITIIERREFRGFKTGASGAVAALTEDQILEADAFVVATGAWTPLLREQLGCRRIPIQPGKGYSITTSRPTPCPRIPMIFPETRVAVTPWSSGYRLGSTMEFAGYDESLRAERLELLVSGAAPYLIQPLGDAVEESWFGFRPMTYDGIPIIGPCPEMGNVIIAAGHGMLGMSMAPATGRLVAEMITGTKPHIDPAPYSLGRF